MYATQLQASREQQARARAQITHHPLGTFFWKEVRQFAQFLIPAHHSVLVIGTESPHPQWVSGDLGHLPTQTFDTIYLGDACLYEVDITGLLEKLRPVCHARTQIIAFTHSTLWRPARAVARLLGASADIPYTNWLSPGDMTALFTAAGFQTVSQFRKILAPFSVLGLGRLTNRWVAPLCPAFNMTYWAVFSAPAPRTPKSISLIVPCRNEAGNISHIIPRTPDLGAPLQWIFIEGNSSDPTWAEIQKLPGRYPELSMVCCQQSGKGKGNAVREGFAHCTGDIILILDSDLAVPPEELPRFIAPLRQGICDMSNGSRLMYPMRAGAMQFLNQIANWFFGVAFSWLLGTHLKDTLCGTKVFWTSDFRQSLEDRAFFDHLDPFGDFDMLFSARKNHLRVLDIPVHYFERQYGSTNIQRWHHGAILLKMLWLAARKLKFV